MSHGVLAPQRSTFASRKTVNGSRGSTTPWVRPADWLALTTPSTSDQRMVGLAAVFQSNSNFVTVRASSAFKVDWGDGAGWNLYAANTTAEKNLQWADYDAGTLCSRGYRQAIVTVEPQSGNLTGLSLQNRHSSAAATSNTSSVWLDLRIACNGTPSLAGPYAAWVPRMLEQVEIASPVTSAMYLFFFCYALRCVGALNTSASTSFAGMFQHCYSLQQVPALDTAAGTNFDSMFYNCYSLQQVPALNTAAGTNFNRMFYNCYSLQQVPALNTAAGTSFFSMFYNCYSLQQVPALDTALGTNFTYMFQGCFALQTVPALDTALGTNFSNMFQNCYALQTVPALNTALGTNFTYMFQNCYALQTVPALDTALGTNFTAMFQSCYALQWSDVYGGRYAISYATANLSAAALDNIYTNLGTASGAQTITVTGNWGTSGHTPSIATAKSWTVAA